GWRRSIRFRSITIEAAPRLSTKKSCLNHLLLNQGRSKPRIKKAGLEDRLSDRKVDVVTDEIHEFKWPHAESARFSDQLINRGRIGGLFGKEPQRLRIEWPGNAIHNK